MRAFPYKKRRVQYSDGSWADVVSVRFPAQGLRFRDIVLSDTQTRIRDAAHLRHAKAQLRDEDNPVIVAWGCLENNQATTKIFPEINHETDSGEHLLSTNSLVTYTLRTLLTRGWFFWEAGDWRLDIPQTETIWQERAAKILSWLKAEDQLWLKTSSHYIPSRADFSDFQTQLNSVAVGRVGFLRRFVEKERYRVAFNTAYFLLEHDDFFSHHSALGDPYNMAVHQGHIVRPPLYRRGTFWRGEDGLWHTVRIGMDDIRLIFPHDPDWQFQFMVNPIDEAEVAVYTRHHGVESEDRVIGHTPTAVGRVEFTVIDRHIVGWKRNGNLIIPQNGFVLSFASNFLSQDHFKNIIHNRNLNYSFLSPNLHGMQEAIQCGPLLIQNGEPVLTEDVFSQEQFWISRVLNDEYVIGLVPSDYPTDIDITRAGRVGIGINEQQEIVLVAVSGVNSGFNFQNTDSSGSTLSELTNELLEAGAIEAINLDGGGSSQLFLEGGLVTRPGDRRGLSGIIYERMIPSAGVVPGS
jgi:hypothetical protein